MPKVIPRRLSLCAVAGVIAAACTTTSPPPAAPAPTPKPKDSTVAPAAPVTARWTPSRSAGSWRYELHSTGAVSLSGDTSANSLPLGRTVLYTVSIAPATPPSADGPAFQLTGSVDSVAVTIPERIPTPTAGSNSKPHFQGAIAADGHVLSLSSNATTSCTNATDPLHRCMGETQGGHRETPGSRPHIHSAVMSCTTINAAAAVVSHVFICNMPEKPRVNSGRPAGVCAWA